MSALSNLRILAVLLSASEYISSTIKPHQLINNGHHLTVFFSGVSVLSPEKYAGVMEW